MRSASERLGLPSPFRATTFEMVNLIARISGQSRAFIWRAHPLRGHDRDGLKRHYAAALNALDFGVDLQTGSQIGMGRILAMVFEDDALLHPLDRARRP